MKQGFFRSEAMGNVVGDAKAGVTSGGTGVANFTLAVNDSYKDRNGNEQEKTTWVKCAIYGKRGEALAPYIKKGISLFVAGRVNAGKPWEHEKDGWKSDLVLTVGNGSDDFRFLGGGSREAESAASTLDTGDELLYTEEPTVNE